MRDGSDTAPGIGDHRLLVLLVGLCILSQAFLTLLPSILSAVADRLHVSAAAMGYIAGVEFGAAAVVGVAVLAWGHHATNRGLAMVGLLLMAGANAASVMALSPGAFSVCRGFAGCGAGLLSFAWSRAASCGPRPGVVFALANGASMLFGFVGFAVFSAVMSLGGVPLLLGVFVAASLAMLPVVGSLPDETRASEDRGPATPSAGGNALVTASCMLHFTANAALWAFLAALGHARGLPDALVHRYLAISMLGGLAGAWAAARWSRHREPLHALVASIIVIALATAALFFAEVPLAFASSAFLINVAVLAATPLYLAQLASWGGTRGTTLGMLAIKFGIAAGPPLGAVLISRAAAGSTLLIAALAAFAFALVLLLASALWVRSANRRRSGDLCLAGDRR